MRRFLRYSYILVLLATCVALSPFLLKERFASKAPPDNLSAPTDGVLPDAPENSAEWDAAYERFLAVTGLED